MESINIKQIMTQMEPLYCESVPSQFLDKIIEDCESGESTIIKKEIGGKNFDISIILENLTELATLISTVVTLYYTIKDRKSKKAEELKKELPEVLTNNVRIIEVIELIREQDK